MAPVKSSAKYTGEAPTLGEVQDFWANHSWFVEVADAGVLGSGETARRVVIANLGDQYHRLYYFKHYKYGVVLRRRDNLSALEAIAYCAQPGLHWVRGQREDV